jgi:hypothetical protein
MLLPLAILPGLSRESIYAIKKIEKVEAAEEQSDHDCSDYTSDGICTDLLVIIEVVLEVS